MNDPLNFYYLFKDEGSFRFGSNVPDKYILSSRIFREKFIKSSTSVKINRNVFRRKIKFVDGAFILSSISKIITVKIDDINSCSKENKLIRLYSKKKALYIYFKSVTESSIFYIVVDGLLKKKLYYEKNDY